MSDIPTDNAREVAYETLKDEIDRLTEIWENDEIIDWLDAIIIELSKEEI